MFTCLPIGRQALSVTIPMKRRSGQKSPVDPGCIQGDHPGFLINYPGCIPSLSRMHPLIYPGCIQGDWSKIPSLPWMASRVDQGMHLD